MILIIVITVVILWAFAALVIGVCKYPDAMMFGVFLVVAVWGAAMVAIKMAPCVERFFGI